MSLDRLELRIEMGITAEANLKANFENAQVRLFEQLRGGGDADLVEIGGHRPAGCPPKKAAKSSLVHMNVPSEPGKIYHFSEVSIEMGADSVDALLVLYVAHRANSVGRKSLSMRVAREIRKDRQ